MVLPLVTLCLVALVGLLALAIDIGMIAVARSQCQNAADAAASAGARVINGNSTSNYNYSAIPGAAIKAATYNKVFTQYVQGDPNNYTTINPYTFQSGQVTVEVGSFAYIYNDSNPSSEGFRLDIPRVLTGEPYSAVRATVAGQGNYFFARVFGLSAFNTSAQAVAAHRPRDVMIIVDLSGSMRFQSLPGIPMSGTSAFAASTFSPRVQSMNPESVFPQFGHYSSVASAALQGTSSFIETSGESVDPTNLSSSQNSGPPICADFYQNAVGVAPGPSNVAFTRAPDAYNLIPGGDNYQPTNGTSTSPPTYASTAQEITNGAQFNGYTTPPYTGGPATSEYQGYTQGPGYWGKTFFIWPPDPRGPNPSLDPNNASNHANNGSKDWRQRFFFKYNTSTGTLGWLDHNSILFNASGSPASQSSPNPTPIINAPGTVTSVTEFGSSVNYTYRINYAAIFEWLFNETPQPFPTTLQAGRIRYYSALPDWTDTTLNNRFWTTQTLSNLNERFWRDYIDFVLGVRVNGSSGGLATYTNTQNNVPISSLIGNGDYYAWGQPVQIRDRPDPSDSTKIYLAGNVNNAAGYPAGYTGPIAVKNLTPSPLVGDYVTFGTDTTNIYLVTAVTGTTSITLNKALVVARANNDSINAYPYMDYKDNPYRPRHQFWFGPMTFLDWLGNYNLWTSSSNSASHHWWPGNCHEAHAWACKVGVQTSIDDIQNNHPNDIVGLTFFSTPKYSAAGNGHHNRAVVPLGRNYQQLKDSLWFPPSTVTGSNVGQEITPFDPDMTQVPRSDGGTSPGMGFMIAYNQLSSSTTNLRFYAQPQPQYRGDAGGLGRKGAARLIIFETDGFPNTRAFANLVSAGADSYYPIRITNPQNLADTKNVEWPSSGGYSNSEVYNVVSQICASTTANPPGYSTVRKPAQVYCIGYGSIFDPANVGTASYNTATTFLQQIQFLSGVQASASTPLPAYQLIYGPMSNRINAMRQAFTNILQNEVQVSLIQ
jgi:hypothetical protein